MLIQLSASARVHEAVCLCVKFALSLDDSSLNFKASRVYFLIILSVVSKILLDQILKYVPKELTLDTVRRSIDWDIIAV